MDVQPADPAYRRRVVRTLIAVALLLLIVFVAFQFWLRHAVAQLDVSAMTAKLRLMQWTCTMLIAVCVAALGTHLLLRGNLIVSERRFPPHDVRAVRAVPVREGEAAVRVGRVSQILGLVAMVVAVLVASAAWLWIGLG